MKILARRALLYCITQGKLRPDTFATAKAVTLETIVRAISSGVELIQIREKHLDAKNLFELAKTAVEVARGSATKILVNERFDIALAANAHGVHLPTEAVTAEVVRCRVPKNFVIGVSTHNAAEVGRAVEFGADFATFGPIHATPGKSLAGIAGLEQVCREFPQLPIIALGGITEANASDVLDAGAAGIAAIRMFSDLESLARIAEQLKREAGGEE